LDFYKETEAVHLAAELKKRKKRRAISIVLVIAIILSTLAGAAAYMYNDLFGNMGGQFIPPQTFSHTMRPEETDPNFPAMYDLADASNLREFLREWWYNGGDDMIRFSKDILNVLLVGTDPEDEYDPGRSDAMMLISINQKERMITLLSFLRDSYCYLNIDGREVYYRLNSSYFYGGPEGVREAIQRLYKIRIDHYVAIDMRSFPQLINALGGVTVDVTEAEARFINRTAPSMNRSFPAGEGVHLNGRQALVYTRIRKLDSDMARVGRQKKVIEGLIQAARTASLGQVNLAARETLPFVDTDMTEWEIMRMIPQAMGWLNFGMTKMHSPVVDEGPFQTAVPATINGMQLFVADFPLAAQRVQLALYGETNIILEQEGADRAAYFNSLLRNAADRPPAYHPSLTTQPDEHAVWPTDEHGMPAEQTGEDQLTQPNETTTNFNWSPHVHWPFTQQPATLPAEEPETGADIDNYSDEEQ